MEKIIEKLKKLLALAERGEAGEAHNARRLLENELRKHNLTLEDLASDKRKNYVFPYKDKDERRLLVQILVNVCGSKSEAFTESTYNSKKKRLYAYLTDMEYIDVSNMYDFHRSHLRKEKERLLKELFSAYVNKHNIFDKDPSERTTPDEEVDWDEIRRILHLAEGMEDVQYHKAITA